MSRAKVEFKRRYGPWAVITGASEGIGRAFAQALAARGLNLVLVARREPLLVQLAAELLRVHGTQCRVLGLDLTEGAAVQQLADQTSDLEVGLLVAAAGFGSSGPLLANPLADEVDMVALNCSSVLAQVWHFGPRMVKRGYGGVVFMSSLLAFQGTPRSANYAATKAYVQSLAEGLRVEWAPAGVDVIASAPGPIQSGFARRADMRMAQALPAEVVASVTLQVLGRQTTVRPGWLSKLLGWSLAMLPRGLRVLVIARVMRGMTAHRPPA